MAASSVFSIISRNDLIGLLDSAEVIEIFFGAEARIGSTSLDQIFDDNFINLSSLRLSVRSICALFMISEIAFIRDNAEVLELFDQIQTSSLNFSLLVRVFQTEEVDTIRLICKLVGDHRREKRTRV